ncbi:MAG TPA: GNAT family protein [Thermohalobaculum sp.]|nr:GNAT family protein [Thermohalobaculum sp.]
MFARRNRTNNELQTDRLLLRPPQARDFDQWASLRGESQAFLSPWEPVWSRDHLSSRAFRNRVAWAERAIRQGEAYPLFLFRRKDGRIVGGITLSNVRRQPAQAATLGYWVGEEYALQGYMTEAILVVRQHAFSSLDLSRLEAGCLESNIASRRLLERCGFKYEGVAEAYLQIDGKWRDHVLYASLRADRISRVTD